MANWDNQSTKLLQEEQAIAYSGGLVDGYVAEVDEGLIEGNAANPNILPVFWFNKTLSQLTSKERAYFVGREVRLWEIAEARSK